MKDFSRYFLSDSWHKKLKTLLLGHCFDKSFIKYQKLVQSACKTDVLNPESSTYREGQGCKAVCEGQCEEWNEDGGASKKRMMHIDTPFIASGRETERPSSPTVHTDWDEPANDYIYSN